MNKWAISLALLIVCQAATAATVYKKVDENGNLIFSDTPMDDAEKLEVKPVPTLKIDKTPKFVPTPEKVKETVNYQSLEITSPVQDENFINNMGTVTVTVQSTPTLNPEHQVQLLFNGVKRAGPSATTSFSFSNLDRGTYEAKAQVIDTQGKTLITSPPITFHVKRPVIRN
ncbi:MAG: DUF4124 domain-containing protein [Pseudomonadales bacterium]|nr:DUF4124 domain-containing protein [Pseudomonadales bacterium]